MNSTHQIIELLTAFAALPLEEFSYKDNDCELHVKHKSDFISPESQGLSHVPPIKDLQEGVSTAPFHVQKSPLVGTFYSASGPGQPDFVCVGAQVKKGDPLCIVEAMKVMNTIEADVDGKVVAILAQNGQVVQFDAELFHILPDSLC